MTLQPPAARDIDDDQGDRGNHEQDKRTLEPSRQADHDHSDRDDIEECVSGDEGADRPAANLVGLARDRVARLHAREPTSHPRPASLAG